MFKIGEKYVKDLVPNYTYVNPYPTVWGWGMDGYPRILQYKHYLILRLLTTFLHTTMCTFRDTNWKKFGTQKKKRETQTHAAATAAFLGIQAAGVRNKFEVLETQFLTRHNLSVLKNAL